MHCPVFTSSFSSVSTARLQDPEFTLFYRPKTECPDTVIVDFQTRILHQDLCVVIILLARVGTD